MFRYNRVVTGKLKITSSLLSNLFRNYALAYTEYDIDNIICREEKNKYSAIQLTRKLGLQNEKREIEGLPEAMNQLNLTEGTIITFDQEDKVVKDGKTIRLIPGWKWMG